MQLEVFIIAQSSCSPAHHISMIQKCLSLLLLNICALMWSFSAVW